MIGERLKLARTAAGLSLRELSAKIDGLVSAQAIGKYERDEMAPISTVRLALRKALGVSNNFLIRHDAVAVEGVEFRKRTFTSKKERARLTALILEAAEKYGQLEDVLGIDAAWQFPNRFPMPVANLTDAEEAADVLRGMWRLADHPIANLAELIEEHRIKVFPLAMEDGFSGMKGFVRRADGRRIPFIVVNAKHVGERQRFTLAHELGHHLLDLSKAADAERACYRFAGALLVPAERLKREVGMFRKDVLFMPELFGLKPLFGVSAQTIIRRCAELKIIPRRVSKTLFELLDKRGWRQEEPNPLAPEQPKRFMRLTLRALGQERVTYSRAAELLGVHLGALRTSMDRDDADVDATTMDR
jgi:Zn-dependent peptidase ImmA (M78 family)